MDKLILLPKIEKFEEAMDGLRAPTKDHEIEVKDSELEELHHSIDIKEEYDPDLQYQEDVNKAKMNQVKSKSKGFCCVHGCNSTPKRDPDVSFHKFPKEGQFKVKWTNQLGQEEVIDRRKAWMKSFKMGREASKYMVVCSKHFKPENYFVQGYPTSKRNLKKDSVPSTNLPELPRRGTVVKSSSKVAAARRERRLKRHKHHKEKQLAQETD